MSLGLRVPFLYCGQLSLFWSKRHLPFPHLHHFCHLLELFTDTEKTRCNLCLSVFPPHTCNFSSLSYILDDSLLNNLPAHWFTLPSTYSVIWYISQDFQFHKWSSFILLNLLYLLIIFIEKLPLHLTPKNHIYILWHHISLSMCLRRTKNPKSINYVLAHQPPWEPCVFERQASQLLRIVTMYVNNI